MIEVIHPKYPLLPPPPQPFVVVCGAGWFRPVGHAIQTQNRGHKLSSYISTASHASASFSGGGGGAPGLPMPALPFAVEHGLLTSASFCGRAGFPIPVLPFAGEQSLGLAYPSLPSAGHQGFPYKCLLLRWEQGFPCQHFLLQGEQSIPCLYFLLRGSTAYHASTSFRWGISVSFMPALPFPGKEGSSAALPTPALPFLGIREGGQGIP
jgi:hypothetical protein